jgi:ABC-type branched-subunit amino acid transport system ATPase component
MIELFQLIRNVGQFESVAGGQLPLTKLSLIYAENGRGKTTLASILRSLGTGDATAISQRKRLASTNPPHMIVKESGGTPIQFQAGTWSRTLPAITVFDDTFVAENVCSGMEVVAAHRQNLHELILGAQGVALNRVLQGHIDAIEEHNRKQRANSEAIPVTLRGTLTVDAFCALTQRPHIDVAIPAGERKLAAAQPKRSRRAGRSLRSTFRNLISRQSNNCSPAICRIWKPMPPPSSKHIWPRLAETEKNGSRMACRGRWEATEHARSARRTFLPPR